jgi:hypothetical protein
VLHLEGDTQTREGGKRGRCGDMDLGGGCRRSASACLDRWRWTCGGCVGHRSSSARAMRGVGGGGGEGEWRLVVCQPAPTRPQCSWVVRMQAVRMVPRQGKWGADRWAATGQGGGFNKIQNDSNCFKQFQNNSNFI